MTSSDDAARQLIDRRRRDVFLEKADTDRPDHLLRQLRRLSDDDVGIGASLLARACAEHGLTPSQPPRVATRGTFHRLYEILEKGCPSLLRVSVFTGVDAAVRMEIESGLVSRLWAASVPVPASTTRRVRDGDSVRGTQLMNRAEGVTMQSLDSDERRLSDALGQVARLLDRIHQIRGEGYGPMSTAGRDVLAGLHTSWDEYVRTRLESHIGACRIAGVITTAEADAISLQFETRLDPEGRQGALLHGDPGGTNVLIDANRVTAVIDWEDALFGDPLFDVASLCCFHPERRHQVVFRALNLNVRQGGDLWRRFWLYFLRIALARTVHRLRFGYSDGPGRPPASRRIQLALARLAGECGVA